MDTEERIYLIKAGKYERGPFTLSDIGILYSHGVLSEDTVLQRAPDHEETVASALGPFLVEFEPRKLKRFRNLGSVLPLSQERPLGKKGG